jgi:DNA-binding response OmpR family regulator
VGYGPAPVRERIGALQAEPCLLYPWEAAESLSEVLRDLGVDCVAVSSLEEAERLPDREILSLCVVDATREGAFGFCRALRANEFFDLPILLIIERERLFELESRTDLFDDFACFPVDPDELAARIRVMRRRFAPRDPEKIIVYGPLALNTETYQAAIEGRPLDLTYMEYELLRFFASNPGKVFRRETLLNKVWGYDYYGGARTVDVHVRRLRAKLGEEHAHLIQTVRSVGYRFGQSRWNVHAAGTDNSGVGSFDSVRRWPEENTARTSTGYGAPAQRKSSRRVSRQSSSR